MNLHVISGRLGHDPETQTLPSGTVVCNASIATDETYKDRDGQRQKRTTWHRVTLFGPPAESFAQHVSKGRGVTITGSVRRRTAQDNEGIEREYVDTVARSWEFAPGGRNDAEPSNKGNGRRNTQPRRGSAKNAQRKPQRSQPPAGEFDDDIPF